MANRTISRQNETKEVNFLDFVKTEQGQQFLANFVISKCSDMISRNEDDEDDKDNEDDNRNDEDEKIEEENQNKIIRNVAVETAKNEMIKNVIIKETTKNIVIAKTNEGIRNIQNAFFVLGFNLEKTGKIDLPTILEFKNKIIEIQLKLKEKGYSLGKYGVDGICGDYTIEGI